MARRAAGFNMRLLGYDDLRQIRSADKLGVRLRLPGRIAGRKAISSRCTPPSLPATAGLSAKRNCGR